MKVVEDALERTCSGQNLMHDAGSHFSEYRLDRLIERYRRAAKLFEWITTLCLLSKQRHFITLDCALINPAKVLTQSHRMGSLYRSPSAIMAHAILAILLASATAATFVGRRANNLVSQGRCLVPWILA